MSTAGRALARLLLAALLALAPALAAAPDDLALLSRIELPGIRGRVDHLAHAPDRKLLFVAGLGADRVEVIDLANSRVVAHLPAREPQGVAYSAPLHRAYVANGASGTVEAFEATTRVAAARDLPDADNLRLDPDSELLYVGYGRNLAALDARTLAVTRRFTLPGHPEAFQLSGNRIYVNVPTASAVLVLDRDTGTIASTWSVAPAQANFAMAVDAPGHRLFVATRQPPGLLVFDTETGRRVATLATCGDSDDLFLQDRRLYVICGDGHVDVVRASPPDRYEPARRIVTSEGARTGLWVPAPGRLYVAAPARHGRAAAVLVFGER